MVQDADIDQAQRLFQARCQRMVGGAGLRMAARMVMDEEYRRRMVAQALLQHHARVNFRAVQAALEQLLVADQAVPRVQVQAREDLPVPVTQLDP